MSDEPQLQVTRKDEKSSLSLSTARSGLIARGRRDAEAIARQATEPVDPLSETRRLAEAGDADAQFNLGWKYRGGTGIPQNFAEAVRWYRAAAGQGHAEAQIRLGEMYDCGWGLPKDYAEAVRWYRAAAEQGNSEGQHCLGTMYRAGQGVPQDYAEALAWFRKAGDQLHLYALSDLGAMYEKGEGVPLDRTEAGRWYCRAADLALDALDGDFESSGWDIDAITDILQKGAEYGHAKAQGVTVAYYRAGAYHGRLWCQFELGSLYSRGQWVPQDYVQAHMWFNLAASISMGDDQRKYASARDAVAAKMTHDQIAEAQRRALEWKPTSRG